MTLLVLAVLAASCGHGTNGSLPMRLVQDIALPGPAARFDYQAVDADARRLFVAHLGGDQIDVIDLDALRVVATVPDIKQVHGLQVAPGIGRLYASATGDDQVVTLNESALAVLARSPAGGYPDGIAYAPLVSKVYVSNEHGGSETVLDAVDGHVLTTIPLGGQAGNVVYDRSSQRVVVAVQTRNRLAEIDPRSDRVVGSVALHGCDHGHGLYIEPQSSLAFVACDADARLVIVDVHTMHTTGSYRVGSTPDVLAFDPGLRRLYVASESGEVAVFEVTGRSLRRLGLAKLAPNAHSVAVDPATHRVFFPLEGGGGHGPKLRVMVAT